MSAQPDEIEAIRTALQEVDQESEGLGRNAKAERLLERAEATGDRPLIVDALFTLVHVYNFSSEKDKVFVPYARALRMWDERPQDFDEYNVYLLHWIAKWVSSGMLDQPDIPLATIEKWQTEMERRYRLAGHSARAVHLSEHRIARDIGDEARAERAYTAWLAAGRDQMADCRACELHAQGRWLLRTGGDAAALDTWRPVLDGTYTCQHEPHAVLAWSLLPLVRLGRLDEARANHLRGHRMVRPMESMRDAVAAHIEFCALTGNEARGLEILAERPAYLVDTGNPDSLMYYLAATCVLARRLVDLGYAEQEMPGPAGREWTAATLAEHAEAESLAVAARFDERNGTAAVSTRIRDVLAGRPLVDRLPLGVRAARLAAPGGDAAARPPGRAPAVPDAPAGDFASMLAEARRLTEEARPRAGAAWEAAQRAAEREDVELGALERAEIAAHRVTSEDVDDGRATELLETAAGLYEEAGAAGKAVAARSRVAYTLALTGQDGAALERSAEALEQARALHETGAADARDLATALLSRARVLSVMAHRTEEPGDLPERAAEALREVVTVAESGAEGDRELAVRASEAHARLGALAAHGADPAAAAEEAAACYGRSVAAADAAGAPWHGVWARAQLAHLSAQRGDHAGAERSALAALEHGAGLLPPGGLGDLHHLLMEVCTETDRPERAVEHALQAAHWADEAGLSEGPGAWARFRLGGLLTQLGRFDEAAAVLETALADLSAERHGDGAVVQAQWWLGHCLSELDDHRGAAERFLLAAEIAKGWPEQDDHAMLAHLAASALDRAGMRERAGQAYERAGQLWRGLGLTEQLVKTLRARAWLVAAEGEAALGLMSRAVTECEQALAAADSAADSAAARALLADTYRQTADLVYRTADDGDEAAYEQALSWADRAAKTFRAAGETGAATAAELLAGWIEADVGRAEAAAERARRVAAGCEGDETAQAREHLEEARNLLRYASA